MASVKSSSKKSIKTRRRLKKTNLSKIEYIFLKAIVELKLIKQYEFLINNVCVGDVETGALNVIDDFFLKYNSSCTPYVKGMSMNIFFNYRKELEKENLKNATENHLNKYKKNKSESNDKKLIKSLNFPINRILFSGKELHDELNFNREYTFSQRDLSDETVLDAETISSGFFFSELKTKLEQFNIFVNQKENIGKYLNELTKKGRKHFVNKHRCDFLKGLYVYELIDEDAAILEPEGNMLVNKCKESYEYTLKIFNEFELNGDLSPLIKIGYFNWFSIINSYLYCFACEYYDNEFEKIKFIDSLCVPPSFVKNIMQTHHSGDKSTLKLFFKEMESITHMTEVLCHYYLSDMTNEKYADLKQDLNKSYNILKAIDSRRTEKSRQRSLKD
ncbi:MAG: hypothetical protein ACOCP4_04985 [Candidatus Woesearchaeota archaeon]